MPGFWGADSLNPLNTSVQGTTLANYVINVQYAGAPHDQIVWWGRYLDYGSSSGRWQGDAEAIALRNAVKGYANPTGGSSWILPIASPGGGINGTYSQGFNDGWRMGGYVLAALSSNVHLPGSGRLYCYLNVESATNLYYLQGWGDAIDRYPISGSYPLYPGVYVDPINHANDYVPLIQQSYRYFQAISNQRHDGTCTNCRSPGPAWGPYLVPGLPTSVWQYSTSGNDPFCYNCRNQTIYVDLDQTDPSVPGQFGNGMCDNMLWISP